MAGEKEVAEPQSSGGTYMTGIVGNGEPTWVGAAVCWNQGAGPNIVQAEHDLGPLA